MYSEQFQKLNPEEQFEILRSVNDGLKSVTQSSYPNLYTQLTSSESKRRILHLVVNEKTDNNRSLLEIFSSIESNLETD
jgi:hypothetical protein